MIHLRCRTLTSTRGSIAEWSCFYFHSTIYQHRFFELDCEPIPYLKLYRKSTYLLAL